MRTGTPPSSTDQLGHGAAGDQVVDHRRTRLLGQLAAGDQGGERGGRDRGAQLVDQEATVGVAVEGQAEVGALADHAVLEVAQVGRLDRVRLVVGEGAVELEVHRHQLDQPLGQPFEDRGCGVAGHAVAGVGHDLELAGAGHRHQRDEVLGVGVEQVEGADLAGRLDAGARRDHEVPDLVEPGLQAERHRVGPAQLDPVVRRGVVARGEHRAGHAEVAGCEVEHVGGRQPDHHDVGAGLGGAGREGVGEPRRARPHVVADDDRGGPGHLGVRPAGRPRQRLVDLLRHQSPDVVGLEDGSDGVGVDFVRHGREPRGC